MVLLLWSLAGGLLLASAFLVARRWLWSDAAPEPEGYFPIAAEEPAAPPEIAAGNSEERAQAFERLLEDARKSSIDLERHFVTDVLPRYDEATRYSDWLLGFERRPKASAGVADSRPPEDERKD